jgi:hypothetical protein
MRAVVRHKRYFNETSLARMWRLEERNFRRTWRGRDDYVLFIGLGSDMLWRFYKAALNEAERSDLEGQEHAEECFVLTAELILRLQTHFAVATRMAAAGYVAELALLHRGILEVAALLDQERDAAPVREWLEGRHVRLTALQREAGTDSTYKRLSNYAHAAPPTLGPAEGSTVLAKGKARSSFLWATLNLMVLALLKLLKRVPLAAEDRDLVEQWVTTVRGLRQPR